MKPYSLPLLPTHLHEIFQEIKLRLIDRETSVPKYTEGDLPIVSDIIIMQYLIYLDQTIPAPFLKHYKTATKSDTHSKDAFRYIIYSNHYYLDQVIEHLKDVFFITREIITEIETEKHTKTKPKLLQNEVTPITPGK